MSETRTSGLPSVEDVANAISRNPCDTDYDNHKADGCSQARAVLALLVEAAAGRQLLWAQVDAWDEGFSAGLTPPCNANPYHAAALRADRIESGAGKR